MKKTNINQEAWEAQAADHKLWQHTISSGAELFENDHQRTEEIKWERQKLCQAQPCPPPT